VAEVRKILGQINPAATTAEILYQVPTSKSAVTSTINVCNQGSSSATYRLSVRPSTITLAALHYLAYDVTLAANDSIAITIGACMSAADVLEVYASTATMSFSAFGAEIT